MTDLVFPRRCRRHVWVSDGVRTRCERCNRERSEPAAARGRSARRRGNDFERELARKLGLVRVGQYGGPEDLTSDWLVVQSKVRRRFPDWIWDALPPAPAGQTRAVAIADAPGPGRRRRVLVCVPLEDWAALHGGG
jgi:hypothetical protein